MLPEDYPSPWVVLEVLDIEEPPKVKTPPPRRTLYQPKSFPKETGPPGYEERREGDKRADPAHGWYDVSGFFFFLFLINIKACELQKLMGLNFDVYGIYF